MNELYQYCVDHYEEGGHWIAETWDSADYQEVLDECAGNIAKAKAVIRSRWELICAQERNCAWE